MKRVYGVWVAFALLAAFAAVRSTAPNSGLRSAIAVEPSATKASSESRRITPACQQSIEVGTKWLLSAMRRDGTMGTDIGHPPDLGCTAITGLALLAEGSTPMAGRYSPELRRILDAVLRLVDRLPAKDDPNKPITLIQRKIGRNAHRFLAALFLSQVLGESGPAYEKDVRTALQELVQSICQAQLANGTWGDESWAPVLGTVLGWQSLRAASNAGFEIEASAKLSGDALLAHLRSKTGQRHDDWMHDFYKDASSIRVLYSLNLRDDPVFKLCVERILKIARTDNRPFIHAGGEEFLAFFLVTECLMQQPDPDWQTWYPLARDRIIQTQNHDGSWLGHHCITNRTFCTAAALLTLQSPNLAIATSDL